MVFDFPSVFGYGTFIGLRVVRVVVVREPSIELPLAYCLGDLLGDLHANRLRRHGKRNCDANRITLQSRRA
jgi:hypothetical protein